MKLYIANGTYVGTQAEAKAITKDFEQVEVPVDKAGLIEYLNGLRMAVASEVEAVVIEPRPAPDPFDGPLPGETFDLEAAFAAAPMRQRLRLAVTAIDAADDLIHSGVSFDNPMPGEQALTDLAPCTLGQPAGADLL